MAKNERLEAALREYDALNAQILFYLESQRKAYFAMWVSASVLIGVGLERNQPMLLLLVPVFTFGIGLFWCHASRSVMKIGQYIKENIQMTVPELKWESFVHNSQNVILPDYFDEWAPRLSAIALGIVSLLLWFSMNIQGASVFSCYTYLPSWQFVSCTLFAIDIFLLIANIFLFKYYSDTEQSQEKHL